MTDIVIDVEDVEARWESTDRTNSPPPLKTQLWTIQILIHAAFATDTCARMPRIEIAIGRSCTISKSESGENQSNKI